MSQDSQMIQVSDNVAISACNNFAVLKSGVSIELNARTSMMSAGEAPKNVMIREPKDGKIKPSGAKGDVAAWGANNLEPQDKVKLIKKDTEIAPILKKKAALMSGYGVVPAKITGFDKQHRPIIEIDIEKNKEAYNFLRSRKFNHWLREAAIDYCYFANIFPELIFSADKKSVIRIAHKEATDCRLQVMNEKTKRIEWCHINARWEDYKQEDTISLKVIDSKRTKDVEEIKKDKGRFHYIYLSSYPSPGDGYYQTPAHEGYFLSGWYDVGIAIAELKKYIINQNVSISYEISIDTGYWTMTYKNWDKLSLDEQRKIIKSEMDSLNNDIVGAENANSVFTTSMIWDQMKGDHRELWKIRKLDKNSFEGEYIEDSRESSMHKYRAFGFDPAVLGLGPGRENAGGGSGSDKWAAIKIMLAELYPDRQVILDPVFFAFEYNGWADQGIFPFIIDHPLFATSTASELEGKSPNPQKEKSE